MNELIMMILGSTGDDHVDQSKRPFMPRYDDIKTYVCIIDNLLDSNCERHQRSVCATVDAVLVPGRSERTE